jgi:hypothetical protein
VKQEYIMVLSGHSLLTLFLLLFFFFFFFVFFYLPLFFQHLNHTHTSIRNRSWGGVIAANPARGIGG